MWQDLIGRKFLFLYMPLETSLFIFKNKWACLETTMKRVLTLNIFLTKIWFIILIFHNKLMYIYFIVKLKYNYQNWKFSVNFNWNYQNK